MNKDDRQKHWFKRRRYGYGWTPVTWQGWFTALAFLATVLVGSVVLRDTPRNTYSPEVLVYLVLVSLATILLVVISFSKGPSPKWRWGSKDTDNPDEDI